MVIYYDFKLIIGKARDIRCMKYAIVDLGSNTIRLSVYNTLEGGGFDLLFSEKEMAGIVNYIDQGILSRAGVDRACAALTSFRTLLGHFGMEEMHVFATASLRNIRNTDEAVQAIRRCTGIQVDVLSGSAEAELGYYGALLNCDLKAGAMFDIGGGSSEIMAVRDGAIQDAQSLPVGSLNLFNQCVTKIWPKKAELRDMQARIDQVLDTADLPEKRAKNACAIGGTARAVLKIANAYYGKSQENRTLTLAELETVTRVLVKRDTDARKLILRSCPDRIHTILPGILLMDTLGRSLCREQLFISKYGVREGYLCRKLLNAGT